MYHHTVVQVLGRWKDTSLRCWLPHRAYTVGYGYLSEEIPFGSTSANSSRSNISPTLDSLILARPNCTPPPTMHNTHTTPHTTHITHTDSKYTTHIRSIHTLNFIPTYPPSHRPSHPFPDSHAHNAPELSLSSLPNQPRSMFRLDWSIEEESVKNDTGSSGDQYSF